MIIYVSMSKKKSNIKSILLNYQYNSNTNKKRLKHFVGKKLLMKNTVNLWESKIQLMSLRNKMQDSAIKTIISEPDSLHSNPNSKQLLLNQETKSIVLKLLKMIWYNSLKKIKSFNKKSKIKSKSQKDTNHKFFL